MGIPSVSLVRHWENKICQCLLPVRFLCAKPANKCHFTKDIWECKHISALAQMFIDLKEECGGWGLQRLLHLLSFSSGTKCKFLLVWVALKSPWLYRVNSNGFNACVKESLFFITVLFGTVCLFHKGEWKQLFVLHTSGVFKCHWSWAETYNWSLNVLSRLCISFHLLPILQRIVYKFLSHKTDTEFL